MWMRRWRRFGCIGGACVIETEPLAYTGWRRRGRGGVSIERVNPSLVHEKMISHFKGMLLGDISSSCREWYGGTECGSSNRT
jgi:hypothetical protein